MYRRDEITGSMRTRTLEPSSREGSGLLERGLREISCGIGQGFGASASAFLHRVGDFAVWSVMSAYRVRKRDGISSCLCMPTGVPPTSST